MDTARREATGGRAVRPKVTGAAITMGIIIRTGQLIKIANF